MALVDDDDGGPALAEIWSAHATQSMMAAGMMGAGQVRPIAMAELKVPASAAAGGINIVAAQRTDTKTKRTASRLLLKPACRRRRCVAIGEL